MAVIKASEAVKNGIRFPFKDRVTLRVNSLEFTRSKESDNPMVNLGLEVICGPNGEEVLEYNGTKYNIAGTETILRLIYTEPNISNIIEFDEKLDVKEEEYDLEKPNFEKYRNIMFEAILTAKEKFAEKRDLKTGKFVRIKGADGKDISQGFEINLPIWDVLRRVEKEVNRPF